MRKILAIGFLLLLNGCAHAPRKSLPNPLAQLTDQQLKTIPDTNLCKIINNRRYAESQNVYKEMARRGLEDCSKAEIYCRKLALRKGTQAYTNCHFQYENLQMGNKALQYQLIGQGAQIMAQQQMVNRMAQSQENVARINNSANNQSTPPSIFGGNKHRCTTQGIGNTLYTDCN